jgi:hypothetical protein
MMVSDVERDNKVVRDYNKYAEFFGKETLH